MKRYPAIVREPAIVEEPKFGKPNIQRLREMRKAEKKRRRQARAYSRYKNDYLLMLFADATGYNTLSRYELARLKALRKELEEDYNVPINYLSAYVYKTAYEFFQWTHHTRENAVGFFASKRSLERFGYWLSEQSFTWRKRNSRYPEGFEGRWGRRLNIVNQRLGIGKDEVFEEEVMQGD